ncbi:MAG: FmdB family zinc ribbon protein [Thiotrichales bacterium]
MPIYEYQCTRCGHDMEVMHKMSDPDLTDCPACGEPSLKKLISAAGFRLSGGGWYETDFKSGGKKNVTEKGSASESGGGHSCGSGGCGSCS